MRKTKYLVGSLVLGLALAGSARAQGNSQEIPSQASNSNPYLAACQLERDIAEARDHEVPEANEIHDLRNSGLGDLIEPTITLAHFIYGPQGSLFAPSELYHFCLRDSNLEPERSR